MGAISIFNYAEGKNVFEAYNALVDEATAYHGLDPYNGTISTCELGRKVATVNKRFTKNSLARAYKIAEENDWGEKWQVDYIDCGACGKGKHMYAFYGWAAC